MNIKQVLISMGVAISNISICRAAEHNSSVYTTKLFDDFDILGFMVSPFTLLLGNYFYLMIGAIAVCMMYLKSQNVVLPLMAGIMFSAVFGLYLPNGVGIAILMLFGTGVGALLFNVFKGQGA